MNAPIDKEQEENRGTRSKPSDCRNEIGPADQMDDDDNEGDDNDDDGDNNKNNTGINLIKCLPCN